MKTILQIGRLFVLMAFIGCGLRAARAAEHVYLRSGFDLVCDHQKAVAGHIRLFLTPVGNNYLDVRRQDITGIEAVDDSQEAVASAAKPATVASGTSAADISRLVDRASLRHRLDPDLVASIVHAESGGNVRSVSRAGARGLMQLMPGTAADLGVVNSFAPEQNVAGGTAYFDSLLTQYHENLALALAAYNAGPAAVDRFHGIPPYAETRRYVERVIHDFNRRKLLEARRRPFAVAAVPERDARR